MFPLLLKAASIFQIVPGQSDGPATDLVQAVIPMSF